MTTTPVTIRCRCGRAETHNCPAEWEPSRRHTADSITDDDLDQLYADIDRMKLLIAASSEPGHAVRMAAQYAERAIANGERAERAEAEAARWRRGHETAEAQLHHGRRQLAELQAAIEQAELDAEQQARHFQTVCNERESYRQAWKYEQKRRATAEAAITRVRAVAARLDQFAADTVRPDDRALYRALATDLRAALDPQEPQP